MRLYLKGDYTKKILFGYEELAHRMWFEEDNNRELSISHYGNDEMLQKDYNISLSHNKWMNDNRWNADKIVALHSFLKTEHIWLEFEMARVSDYRELGDNLLIASVHREILTVDRRALYIMAIEVATAIDGQISEDDKASWLTVDEFNTKHQDILALTFEEANEISLQEIFTMTCVDDPIWEELDKKQEEYIKIHGERIYEDDEVEVEDANQHEYWDFDDENRELILLNNKKDFSSDDDDQVFGF